MNNWPPGATGISAFSSAFHMAPVWCPGVDDIERSQRAKIRFVENRSLLHHPILVAAEKSPAELERTRHRLRIVVEGMKACSQATGCDARQPAAASNIQQPQAAQD